MLPSNPIKTKKFRISDTAEFFSHGCAMPFRSASENDKITLNKLVHALKNPAPASSFRNISDKHILEIADLQNIFKKEDTKQAPTKQIQAQPEIQQILNIPAKKCQTKRNERDTSMHLIPPEDPSELPRVNPTCSPRVNPEGYPRVNP